MVKSGYSEFVKALPKDSNGQAIWDVAYTNTGLTTAYDRAFFNVNPDLKNEDSDEIQNAYITGLREVYLGAAVANNCVNVNQKTGVMTITGSGLTLPKELSYGAIIRILKSKYVFRNINFCNRNDADIDECDLGVYMEDGPEKGIYSTSLSAIRRLIRPYRIDLSKKAIEDIISGLKDEAPVANRTGLKTDEKNLIPVNNGIFNFETKEFMEHSPEYVFTWKSRVNYVENAFDKHFTRSNGEDWSFMPWLVDLMNGSKEDAEVVLYMLSFILRPFVENHRAFFIYSQSVGNSGKGCLAQIMTSLLGDSAVESVTMAQVGDKFALTNIPKRALVLGDDNNYNGYMDASEVFKTLCTSGNMSIDRKFRDPLNCRPYLSMVEFLNSIPRFADHSDAMFRRVYPIEMFRSFKEGKTEDKKIKAEYLTDKEVLEYVLYTVLNMPMTEDMPFTEATQKSFDDVMELNDPMKKYVADVMDGMDKYYDTYPISCLWSLYNAWYTKNFTDTKYKLQSVSKFTTALTQALKDSEWDVCPQQSLTLTDKTVTAYAENGWIAPTLYEVTEFYHYLNKKYYGVRVSKNNSDVKPAFVTNYKGIVRKKKLEGAA